MKKLMTILIALLSYIGGFAAYNLVLNVVWDQSLGGERDFVLFWGGLAFALFAVPIYMGIIHLVDKRINHLHVLFYPLGCMLVFFIPTAFITIRWGSINLFLPEAMLFHAFFITSGLIFGVGSWFMKRFLVRTKVIL